MVNNKTSHKKIDAHERLKALWFGSSVNIQYISQIIPSAIEKFNIKNGLELTILGAPYSLKYISNLLDANNINQNNVSVNLKQWKPNKQPEQLTDELMRAHLTLIPSDPSDPMKQGVSHNRLVDSIQGGCIPIASPMESYKELSKLSLLTNDFGSTLNMIESNYDRLIQKYSQARDQIMDRFSPERNQAKWAKLISTCLTSN